MPLPREISTALGCNAASSAIDDELRLPWCGACNQSVGTASGLSSRARSAALSISPVSSMRSPLASICRTQDF
ncbi:hypothetical protein D3C71_2119210 [compost metagenome]